MAIKFVDRVPTYPNRIKFTAEDGTVKYGVWERADSPTVVGTPINAANLNAIQQSSGATGNVTVYVATTGSDNTGNGTSSSPYATITKALSTIPKNLNGYGAAIYVAEGTYDEHVMISGFIGGAVRFTAATANTNVSISSLSVLEQTVVEMRNINLTITSYTGDNSLYVRGGHFRMYDGIFTISSGAPYGVVGNFGAVIFINTCVVNNAAEAAVVTTNSSNVMIWSLSGTQNNVGLSSRSGSTISYTSNTLSAATNTFTAYGGRIYTGAQTSIPNY